MFMGFIFAIGTIVSLTFGGAWLGSTETSVVNAVTVFKQADILSTWSIAVPNISFFTMGAKALMSMDFAFFQGTLLQWVLFMTLGLGMMWGIFSTAIAVIQGLFPKI